MSQNYIFPLSMGNGNNGSNNEIDLSNYVKKETGKGLSTNDLTDDLLAIIESDHTYAGFTTTDVTDLNNLKTPGIYNFSTAITNCPSGVDKFSIEVFTYYRYVVQKLFGFKASTTASATTSKPTYYVRMYDTMLYSWTSWNLMSGTVATDGALVSTSTNPVQNKVIYDALTKKQDKLTGTEGQLVGFDADGKAVAVEGLPIRAFAGNSSNDERIEITTASLKITKPFRKAIIQLSSTLPSSNGNAGGPVKVEVYRLADGSYASSAQSSPVISPVSANKIRVYNFSVSASVADDGTITMSAGGGYVDIDVANATVSNSGSGGTAGNFANVIVWF